jgi:hypothetical protein
LQGNLTETRFATPQRPGEQGPLVQTSRKGFARDQVTYMSDSVCLSAALKPRSEILIRLNV